MNKLTTYQQVLVVIYAITYSFAIAVLVADLTIWRN